MLKEFTEKKLRGRKKLSSESKTQQNIDILPTVLIAKLLIFSGVPSAGKVTVVGPDCVLCPSPRDARRNKDKTNILNLIEFLSRARYLPFGREGVKSYY